ncbi:MAG: hypothetical protein ACON5J_19245 [Rubripirellula sp.]
MECASCGVGVIRVSLFGKARCDNCSAAPTPEQRSELEKSKSTNSVSSSVSTTPGTKGPLTEAESSVSEMELSAESSQPSPTSKKKPTDSKTDGTEKAVELPWWTSLVSLVSAVGAFGWLFFWCSLYILNEEKAAHYPTASSSTLSKIYFAVAIVGVIPFVAVFLKTTKQLRIASKSEKKASKTPEVRKVAPRKSIRRVRQESNWVDGVDPRTTGADMKPFFGVIATAGWICLWGYLFILAEERLPYTARMYSSRDDGPAETFLGLLCIVILFGGCLPILGYFFGGEPSNSKGKAGGSDEDSDALSVDSRAGNQLLKNLDVEEDQ